MTICGSGYVLSYSTEDSDLSDDEAEMVMFILAVVLTVSSFFFLVCCIIEFCKLGFFRVLGC
jgi:hypothetical protein